ncbi:MAG: restriction endonuclease subunit S [Candidatus Thiodiazotropha sp. L084R]
MAAEWHQTTLGAVASQEGYGVVDGPFGSNLPASSYTVTGVPVIRGSNLTLGLGRFNAESFVFVSEETAQRLARSLCNPQDIVFTKKGTLGQTGLVPDDGYEQYLISSNQMKLTVDKALADPLYVYYYVSSPQSVQKILRDSEATGVPKTNLAYLKDFPICFPSLDEQKAIAHILGTLDDKIELNRQMNATLEAMAQALFKSWFVDFDPVIDNALAAGNPIPESLHTRAEARKALGDQRKPLPEGIQNQFPSRFVFNDDLGWVPEGWVVSPLIDFGEIICGKTPSKKISEYFGGDIPFIKIPDMHNEMFVVSPTEYLSQSGAKSQTKKSVPRGSVCVSCIATVGKVVITTQESHTNQQINSIIPNSDWMMLYLYFSMLDLYKQFHDLASGGSATLNMNTGVFSRVEIVRPDEKALKFFDAQTKGMVKMIEGNLLEIETLSKLRDTLLPKLLSGQLRIPEAEQQLAEVL